eukprot:TRINITY_DN16869_c0_g1_i1.p1 TRINITY_DN16869_c0_g1~~TRINITY_DN16869_c0_g1_i1.p1  ORF type:complete len:232 (-),score=23.07 TRINITY_DN16869_c0_g1_i1:37-732(-)
MDDEDTLESASLVNSTSVRGRGPERFMLDDSEYQGKKVYSGHWARTLGTTTVILNVLTLHYMVPDNVNVDTALIVGLVLQEYETMPYLGGAKLIVQMATLYVMRRTEPRHMIMTSQVCRCVSLARALAVMAVIHVVISTADIVVLMSCDPFAVSPDPQGFSIIDLLVQLVDTTLLCVLARLWYKRFAKGHDAYTEVGGSNCNRDESDDGEEDVFRLHIGPSPFLENTEDLE